jgi:hypothetical protein
VQPFSIQKSEAPIQIETTQVLTHLLLDLFCHPAVRIDWEGKNHLRVGMNTPDDYTKDNSTDQRDMLYSKAELCCLKENEALFKKANVTYLNLTENETR